MVLLEMLPPPPHHLLTRTEFDRLKNMGLAEGRQGFRPLARPITFTKSNAFGSQASPAGAISILIVFPS